jgi:alkylated DNA repair dioxygenase AlkB
VVPEAGLAWQASLFGDTEPRPDPAFGAARRLDLDRESWVDLVPGWLAGADALFTTVLDGAPWEGSTRWMYERKVATPRLTARWAELPPVVEEMAELLGERYGEVFPAVGFNLYRNGLDSVAWHGDRVARELPSAIVAIVSLGDQRRFLLRPKGGGRSQQLVLRSGDLLVMGGATQRLWEHSVPKQRAAGARISITFRHAYT